MCPQVVERNQKTAKNWEEQSGAWPRKGIAKVIAPCRAQSKTGNCA